MIWNQRVMKTIKLSKNTTQHMAYLIKIQNKANTGAIAVLTFSATAQVKSRQSLLLWCALIRE